jgi:hypothetical protein
MPFGLACDVRQLEQQPRIMNAARPPSRAPARRPVSLGAGRPGAARRRGSALRGAGWSWCAVHGAGSFPVNAPGSVFTHHRGRLLEWRKFRPTAFP